MKKMNFNQKCVFFFNFLTCGWIALLTCSISMFTGCGADESRDKPIIANFVSAHPSGGCTSDIAAFGGISEPYGKVRHPL